MGPISRQERVVLGVFVMTFLLWVTGRWSGLEPTVVAFFGLCVLLILGALQWEDVLAERSGWDALIWFGGLRIDAGQMQVGSLIAFLSYFMQILMAVVLAVRPQGLFPVTR
jgi:di/tricarboxylate transporter